MALPRGRLLDPASLGPVFYPLGEGSCRPRLPLGEAFRGKGSTRKGTAGLAATKPHLAPKLTSGSVLSSTKTVLAVSPSRVLAAISSRVLANQQQLIPVICDTRYQAEFIKAIQQGVKTYFT